VPEHIDPFDRFRTSDDDDDLPTLTRPRPGRPIVARGRERIEPWLAWFGVRRVVATAVTIMLAVAGGWWLLRAPDAPTEAALPYAARSAGPSSTSDGPSTSVVRSSVTTAPAALVVHVAGAVVAPGVYEVAGSARTADAVAAAGGASPDADVDALNLAAPLRDGERVYVPIVGEVVPPPVGASGSGATGSVPAGPVDLNRATPAELDSLPGIGPATAAAIVAHRDANGPFATVDDLEQVRGIGPAKLDSIRPLVTL